jgi:HEAT repeat protein
MRERGIDWAQDEEEGRPLLRELAGKSPAGLQSLLRTKEEKEDALAQLAVELLGEAATPQAVRFLSGTLRDREHSSARTRLRAILALVKAAGAEATWPLVLLIHDSREEPFLIDEAGHALKKIPSTEAAKQLRLHLRSDRPAKERYYAVKGLSLLPFASVQGTLLGVVRRDRDAQIRRAALAVLGEQCKDGSARKGLQRGAAVLREAAQRDQDPQARQAAAKLYRAVTGKSP